MFEYYYNYKGITLLYYKDGVRVIRVHFNNSFKYPTLPETSVLKIQSVKAGEKEYEICRRLSHRNIIKLYHYYIENNKFYLFFENGKTDLQKEILKRRSSGHFFRESELISLLFKLSKALKYIHRLRIAHRDIKPLNIIEKLDGEIKLIDFGEAKYIRQQDYLHSAIGTTPYMSPQLKQSFEQRTFNTDPFSDDVWALGITMVELALLNNISKIVQSEHDLPRVLFERLAIQGYSPCFIKLIRRMLEVDFLERITAEDLVLEIAKQEINLEITRSLFIPCNDHQELNE